MQHVSVMIWKIICHQCWTLFSAIRECWLFKNIYLGHEIELNINDSHSYVFILLRILCLKDCHLCAVPTYIGYIMYAAWLYKTIFLYVVYHYKGSYVDIISNYKVFFMSTVFLFINEEHFLCTAFIRIPLRLNSINA